MFLKVSPIRGVVRFGKKGKLAPRYVGPFPVIGCVGSLAYRLELPASMAGIHNVFHVSMLRKCLRDLTDHIPVSEVKIREDLTCMVKPVVILDRSERFTRAGSVRMVKVRWSENEKDVTWELEEKIRDLHLELFSLSVLCMSSKTSSGSGVSVIPYH